MAGERPSDGDSSDSSIPENLICAVCLQLMCEPVMWPTEMSPGSGSCGHLLCKRCTKQCAVRPSPTCPLCRAPAAGDVAVRELVVDQPTVELMKQQAPALYAARMDALEREKRLKASLTELLLYPYGRRSEFKTGYTFSVALRTPAQLWLVVKVSLGTRVAAHPGAVVPSHARWRRRSLGTLALSHTPSCTRALRVFPPILSPTLSPTHPPTHPQLYTSGKRQLGVLFGPETAGTNGRHAFVWNLPFCKPMPVAKAVATVLFEVRRKGHVSLELKVREDYFRVMYVDHEAEAEDETHWARLVRATTPNAYVDATSRLASARVVMAPAEAALTAAVGKALAAANSPIPSHSQPGLEEDSHNSQRSNNSSHNGERFGPYYEFGLAHAMLRRPDGNSAPVSASPSDTARSHLNEFPSTPAQESPGLAGLATPLSAPPRSPALTGLAA